MRAHALLAAALTSDESGARQSTLKEALMQAYFCKGTDLTQHDVLLEIATNIGLPQAAAQTALEDSIAHQKIAAQDAELRRIGIGGVPFFIINSSISVSGTQSPANLLAAMEKAPAHHAA